MTITAANRNLVTLLIPIEFPLAPLPNIFDCNALIPFCLQMQLNSLPPPPPAVRFFPLIQFFPAAKNPAITRIAGFEIILIMPEH